MSLSAEKRKSTIVQGGNEWGKGKVSSWTGCNNITAFSKKLFKPVKKRKKQKEG